MALKGAARPQGARWVGPVFSVSCGFVPSSLHQCSQLSRAGTSLVPRKPLHQCPQCPTPVLTVSCYHIPAPIYCTSAPSAPSTSSTSSNQHQCSQCPATTSLNPVRCIGGLQSPQPSTSAPSAQHQCSQCPAALSPVPCTSGLKSAQAGINLLPQQPLHQCFQYSQYPAPALPVSYYHIPAPSSLHPQSLQLSTSGPIQHQCPSSPYTSTPSYTSQGHASSPHPLPSRIEASFVTGGLHRPYWEHWVRAGGSFLSGAASRPVSQMGKLRHSHNFC